MKVPRKRILILDDQEPWLKSISALLRDNDAPEIRDADLVLTKSSQDAIAKAKRLSFDLVILDQLLPTSSGTEVLEEIRKTKDPQAAIIISGEEPSAEIKKELDDRSVSFIQKNNDFRVAFDEKVKSFNESWGVRVFISYRRDDAKEIMPIYYRLKDEGFFPWIDTIDLIGVKHHRWDKEIEGTIEECDFFLCCLTRTVGRGGPFKKEIDLALARHDMNPPFIIPLVFNNTKTPASLNKLMIQYITHDSFSEGWWKVLLARLRYKRTE